MASKWSFISCVLQIHILRCCRHATAVTSRNCKRMKKQSLDAMKPSSNENPRIQDLSAAASFSVPGGTGSIRIHPSLPISINAMKEFRALASFLEEFCLSGQ